MIERQELVAIALLIICPSCGARVLEMGDRLRDDVGCAHCKRLYSAATRRLMRQTYEKNKERC